MGRRANPTVIGAFIIGAVALIVIGLLVLGRGHFFSGLTDVCVVLRRLRQGAEHRSTSRFSGGQGWLGDRYQGAAQLARPMSFGRRYTSRSNPVEPGRPTSERVGKSVGNTFIFSSNVV